MNISNQSCDVIQLDSQSLTETILIEECDNLLIEGNPKYSGAILQRADHLPHIQIRNCNHITIQNLHLIGPGPVTDDNDLYYAQIQLDGINSDLRFLNGSCIRGGNHGIAHLFGDRTSSDVLIEDWEFSNGGNYGRTDGSNPLRWDGAAVAIGGTNIRLSRCKVANWCRGFEFENPFSDCSFIVDDCDITNCPHVGVWITPTGWENKISGQVFTGRITNSRITAGRLMPNNPPFLPTGISCRGGQDILISGNRVDGMPNGDGIEFSADDAPIDWVQIVTNRISNIGRSGILYRHGWEGKKCKASNLLCIGNMLSGIAGTALDFAADGVTSANNPVTDATVLDTSTMNR